MVYHYSHIKALIFAIRSKGRKKSDNGIGMNKDNAILAHGEIRPLIIEMVEKIIDYVWSA